MMNDPPIPDEQKKKSQGNDSHGNEQEKCADKRSRNEEDNAIQEQQNKRKKYQMNLNEGNKRDTAKVELKMDYSEILQLRRKHIGRNLSLSYTEPLLIVRGEGQYLYDAKGVRYLDAKNNVCHVGHCHPHVVKAAQKQLAILNTNTRYLHPNLSRYAKRLTDTFPPPLSVAFFVNSGSEANDLALRLAKAHTQGTELICIDVAYHGHVSSIIDISPYKYARYGGTGAKPHVHKVIAPDVYKGPFQGTGSEVANQYAEDIADKIKAMTKEKKKLCAFFCESILGCTGQIVLPPGYLATAYKHVREAGGVCVADEVQVGFGRIGTHWWAFQAQEPNVVPDIVTLGKPIGNGFPLAAVITTPAIAASFDNGMEYFNTYGGNPVSMAVGLAVMDVIEQEKLMDNALEVGNYLKALLYELMKTRLLIGDVRGLGFFLGIELVKNRETKEPATHECSVICNEMKNHGILIGSEGAAYNVLKIKPPMVFNKENAKFLVDTLDQLLESMPVLLPKYMEQLQQGGMHSAI